MFYQAAAAFGAADLIALPALAVISNDGIYVSGCRL
jgi:hypothetical protein